MPGALHHVIVRGIERRKIFRSDDDRLNFVNPETKTDCFAWAIIEKHIHFLFRTGSVPVSVFMSRLLTGYAGWFNRKYWRHGQLFQNRYRSILCREITQPAASRLSKRGEQIEKEVRFNLIEEQRYKSMDVPKSPHDLDFGAILAATKANSPSVLKLRAQDISPKRIGVSVISAFQQFGEIIDQGALVSIDTKGDRARILPLSREK